MTTANPVCICRHHRSDHHDDDQTNPKCRVPIAEFTFGVVFCDCPGFEADPKVSDE
ncbi:hypothetical protein ONA92_24285 [Mycobacteroides salmoniphilum]